MNPRVFKPVNVAMMLAVVAPASLNPIIAALFVKRTTSELAALSKLLNPAVTSDVLAPATPRLNCASAVAPVDA